MRVADVMSTPVIALTPAATVAEAVKVMLSRGYTSLPVIDEDDRLIGLVTEAHLGLAQFGPHQLPGGGESVGSIEITVSAIMGQQFASISPDGALADAATAMASSQQRCLPVIRDVHVVGMISWRDLLRVSVVGATAPDAAYHGESEPPVSH